jgi:hypothetical protein
MSMKSGTCRLCRSCSELREGHLIPAAAYKLIQRSGGAPPVVIKAAVTIQKHEQATGYILCANCEQRFSENGEQWVMEHCFRSGEGFKLKDLVDASEPVMGNGLKVYSAANIPQINVCKLAYFVASVMWRGSCHAWKSGRDNIRTPKLGPKYEEEIRRYLMEETDFPTNAVLWVSIVPTLEIWNSFSVPYGEKLGLFWRYKFQFLGIAFMFFVGKLIDPTIRRLCTLRSPEKFIFMGDDTAEFVIRDAGRLIKKSRLVKSMKR